MSDSHCSLLYHYSSYPCLHFSTWKTCIYVWVIMGRRGVQSRWYSPPPFDCPGVVAAITTIIILLLSKKIWVPLFHSYTNKSAPIEISPLVFHVGQSWNELQPSALYILMAQSCRKLISLFMIFDLRWLDYVSTLFACVNDQLPPEAVQITNLNTLCLHWLFLPINNYLAAFYLRNHNWNHILKPR